MDASNEFREGGGQNYLRGGDVARIASATHAFKDVERYARVVPFEEIKENDFNLNISRYVDTAEEEEQVDITSALANMREAERERDAAKATMDELLRELGLGDN